MITNKQVTMKMIRVILWLISGILVVAGFVLFGSTSPVWYEQLGIMLLGMTLFGLGALANKLSEVCGYAR